MLGCNSLDALHSDDLANIPDCAFLSILPILLIVEEIREDLSFDLERTIIKLLVSRDDKYKSEGVATPPHLTK